MTMDSHFAEGALPHLCIIPWCLPYHRKKNHVKTWLCCSSSSNNNNNNNNNNTKGSEELMLVILSCTLPHNQKVGWTVP
jgi:hypothetical protein